MPYVFPMYWLFWPPVRTFGHTLRGHSCLPSVEIRWFGFNTHKIVNPTLANMAIRKGSRPVVAGRVVPTNRRTGKFSSCVLIPRFAGLKFCIMLVPSFFRVHYFLLRFCNFSWETPTMRDVERKLFEAAMAAGLLLQWKAVYFAVKNCTVATS